MLTLTEPGVKKAYQPRKLVGGGSTTSKRRGHATYEDSLRMTRHGELGRGNTFANPVVQGDARILAVKAAFAVQRQEPYCDQSRASNSGVIGLLNDQLTLQQLTLQQSDERYGAFA